MNLTKLEQQALTALNDQSARNGHDFGIVECVKWKGDRKQLGALITTLQKKEVVESVDQVTVNGNETLTQYVIAEAYQA